MRLRAAVGWTTARRWRSGRRSLMARRPKTAKLAASDKLRNYVQDRLAGVIARPDGSAVPGPQVPWGGRRHGPPQGSPLGAVVEPAADLEPAPARVPG